MTCDDGQEQRLQQLAAYFDRNVSKVTEDLGQIGDARLMLLGALMVCDELFETKERLESMEDATDALDESTVGGASRAIEAATARVEEMTAQLEQAAPQ